MGKLRKVSPGALIAGIMFSDADILKKVVELLVEAFGSVEIESPMFDFNMTDYYTAEMGKNLKKNFFCFTRPISLEALPDIKLLTNEIEWKYSRKEKENPRRMVNIDPGYVTMSKLVLASTKDYSHRIFIGKGIFAEITLRFSRGTFIPLETTYPDYRTSLAINYFNKVREFVKRNRYQWT